MPLSLAQRALGHFLRVQNQDPQTRRQFHRVAKTIWHTRRSCPYRVKEMSNYVDALLAQPRAAVPVPQLVSGMPLLEATCEYPDQQRASGGKRCIAVHLDSDLGTATKVLPMSKGKTAEDTVFALREATLLQKLAHPHIVSVQRVSLMRKTQQSAAPCRQAACVLHGLCHCG